MSKKMWNSGFRYGVLATIVVAIAVLGVIETFEGDDGIVMSDKKQAKNKAAEAMEDYKKAVKWIARYEAEFSLKVGLYHPEAYEFVSFHPTVIGDLVKGDLTYRVKSEWGKMHTVTAEIIYNHKKADLVSVNRQ